MGTEFHIEGELRDSTLLLKIEGYLNNTGGEKMLKEFSNHFSDAVSRVVIDMEKSKVVNSIGISCLIELVEKVIGNNSKIIFINMDPAVEKTFEIMGLFQFAEKADSADPVF